VYRIQPWILIFILLFLVGLTGCGSKTAPPGPSVNVPPPPAPQAQGDSPSLQKLPAPATASGRDPLMEQGAHFMSVVNDYKQRLEKDPKDKEALMFLGNANYDINRFGPAADYYKRYLELDPNHAGVRTDLATSYYKIKDVDSALRELKTVLAASPDHEAALYNLGLILGREKKDAQGAVKAWEALLKAHPNYPKAAEIRKQLEVMKRKS